MSGQKGQNGPHSLKCYKCKRARDDHDNARSGKLVRTGRTKAVRGRQGAGPRLGTELVCLICEHRGWYTHRDASRAPIDTR